MGKKSKRGEAGAEEVTGDDGDKTTRNSTKSNGSRGTLDNGNVKSRSDRPTRSSSRDPPEGEVVDFDDYFEVVDDLKTQLVASTKAIKKVHDLYTKQEREIQQAVENKERLRRITTEYKRLRITLDTLHDREKEKDEERQKHLDVLENTRQQLEKEKEKAQEDQRKVADERSNLEKRKKALEAEHALTLEKELKKLNDEQIKTLTNLEKAKTEEFEKRMDVLDKERKRQQEEEEKKIAELEAKHSSLSERFEEQQAKLKDVESKYRDTEMLKKLYETEVDSLRRSLKDAENEFALNTNSDDF